MLVGLNHACSRRTESSMQQRLGNDRSVVCGHGSSLRVTSNDCPLLQTLCPAFVLSSWLELVEYIVIMRGYLHVQ